MTPLPTYFSFQKSQATVKAIWEDVKSDPLGHIPHV